MEVHEAPSLKVVEPSVTSVGSAQSAARPEPKRNSITSPQNVEVRGDKIEPDMEQERIFCLNELLKLQVSIAGSLEMASIAFRHADQELAEAIRACFRQARELSQHAANIVSRYGNVAP